MATNIKPIISSSALNVFSQEVNSIMKAISDKYNIDLKEIQEEVGFDSNKLAIKLGIKRRNRKVLDPCEQCMARKGDGNRCGRSKKGDSEFCLTHQRSLPQGRIDDDSWKEKAKGKRGRKKKECPFETNDDWVPTIAKLIDGGRYLIDGENNVYTYDLESPEKIGTYDPDSQTINK